MNKQVENTLTEPEKYILSLNNISKEYIQAGSNFQVLKNFSLNVKHGESVAIIGASGTGKSSLLHIAGLLDNNYQGQVCINGKAINRNGFGQNLIRLKNIGFVYQQHRLLSNFSARENIALPARLNGQSDKEAYARADELLAKLSLEAKSFSLPGELSGGQQQRVAIARSLICAPSLILADEPTGNLDPENAAIVTDLLLKTAKENNTAIIMVTHNLEIARKLDRIIELLQCQN